MKRADFLVELGTEELPPKSLLTLRDAFTVGVTRGLAEANLQHGDVQSFATPRRLAVLVSALASEQPVQEIENRGPPMRLAFDADGMPTKAAAAFAAKCGVSVDQLSRMETDKGAWLYYKGQAEGSPAADLLPAIVDKALADLPVPKRMRWGANDTEFVRPAHWLLMVHGDAVVSATVLGLQAGNQTYGHRFHSPDAITVTEPASYADLLEKQGYVVADFAERRDRVVAAAHQAAEELGGAALLQDDVVDEVTALVEWPVPVAGHFADSFLRLPREVLISTLQDHQRYFPVTDRPTTNNEQPLKAAFITISNIESTQPDEVRRGNERVVLPRLADAAFFWDQDSHSKLAERIDALDSVVYQQGLGSLRDKSERVAKIAAVLTKISGADATHVARAAQLSRTDLLTDMVGEFPELQGRMGFYYARNDGEDEPVAVALEEQYLPRHAGDRLPQSAVGRALALADRLDTLTGIFTLGKKPTGNKDPFGLRRQALGLIRIIVEGKLDADLPALLENAAQLQPRQSNKKAPAASDVANTVHEFVMDRLRVWYLDGHAPGFKKGDISPEMFAAVLARRPGSLLDFDARLNAVRNFMSHESAGSLAAANKRIANILRKTDGDPQSQTMRVDTGLFENSVEKKLHSAIESLRGDHARDLDHRNYEGLLIRLAGLRTPVDNYFDDVMVMTDNDQQRNNRLAQLRELRTLFLDVADISQL
jgi:glycyl-tRNA synthetase beta chain